MRSSRVFGIIRWVLAVLLALAYSLAALGKLTGAATEQFAGWGYAPWFAMLIGGLELAGGVGLLVPKLTRTAVLGLTGIMLGAIYTHVANAEAGQALRPVIFLALLWTLRWLRGKAAA
ncbi:MAG: hypothetical protein DHS20C21_20010 [Gemmatimonadota bacterium]|nr:MAG: hypothetical protein DHS20C21_20010 [Gemmatimonadota bacterium]